MRRKIFSVLVVKHVEDYQSINPFLLHLHLHLHLSKTPARLLRRCCRFPLHPRRSCTFPFVSTAPFLTHLPGPLSLEEHRFLISCLCHSPSRTSSATGSKGGRQTNPKTTQLRMSRPSTYTINTKTATTTMQLHRTTTPTPTRT